MEVYLYLLIFIFIFYLLKKDNQKITQENFKAINYNNLDRNKLINLDLPSIPKVILLENLPVCNRPIEYFYGFNQNYIWNDGEVVNIDILRQISRNYIIYDKKDRFHLRAIRFSKSNILDNGKSYLLQLELIHSGVKGLCNFDIIVPLEFSKDSQLNILNKNDIPEYSCCSKKYGKIVKQELKQLSDLLNKNKFRKFNINSKQHILVSEPIKISVDLGLDILEKLKSKNENEIKEESSWLEKDFMEI